MNEAAKHGPSGKNPSKRAEASLQVIAARATFLPVLLQTLFFHLLIVWTHLINLIPGLQWVTEPRLQKITVLLPAEYMDHGGPTVRTVLFGKEAGQQSLEDGIWTLMI